MSQIAPERDVETQTPKRDPVAWIFGSLLIASLVLAILNPQGLELWSHDLPAPLFERIGPAIHAWTGWMQALGADRPHRALQSVMRTWFPSGD